MFFKILLENQLAARLKQFQPTEKKTARSSSKTAKMAALVRTLQQWCTDMEILQSDWIRNFFINSISNPYPKI